jgi:ubiquinone/menaquinone biosynthesis C-methylase UbiE
MSSASQPAVLNQKDLGFYLDHFDWDEYIRYRPQYPPSFYARLYNYHSTARLGNIFQTAHDEGTGPGLVAEILAEKFAYVIASDPNVDYIKTAEQRLTTGAREFSKDQFSFHAEGSEKSSVADRSVDCVTILEAIHWTDLQKTVAEAARQLKSGGTFCVVHYNFPQIVDDDSAQRVFLDLISTYATSVQSDSGLQVYHRALQTVATGYDCIGFSEESWERGVERRFTNCRGDRKQIGFPIAVQEIEDQVGKYEKRTFVEDDADWKTKRCDLEWFQRTVGAFFPLSNSEQWPWKPLKVALEQSGGKVTVSWPNVQIFATRK